MPKKKKPTLFGALWEIIIKPAWFWLVTIIPAAISIFQFFGGDESMIANVPARIWLIISATMLILTVTVSSYNYVQELNSSNQSKPKKDAKKNKSKSTTTKSRAKNGGQSVAISGNNYAPIIQESNRVLQSHQETLPNVQVTKFGSEVVTLKLLNKIAGEKVQVGIGETLERFYIEFVNKKKLGVKTEDAIRVYVKVAFYTMDCRLIKSHDKPRWWVKYDPFDESTWEAEVNLEASERPMQLFLVLRKLHGSQFYIFSRQSHEVQNWIIPELELTEKSNYIHIRLSAKNLDAQDYWIQMENLDKNQPLFRLLQEAPCHV
jgi:hypothetical protein